MKTPVWLAAVSLTAALCVPAAAQNRGESTAPARPSDGAVRDDSGLVGPQLFVRDGVTFQFVPGIGFVPLNGAAFFDPVAFGTAAPFLPGFTSVFAPIFTSRLPLTGMPWSDPVTESILSRLPYRQVFVPTIGVNVPPFDAAAVNAARRTARAARRVTPGGGGGVRMENGGTAAPSTFTPPAITPSAFTPSTFTPIRTASGDRAQAATLARVQDVMKERALRAGTVVAIGATGAVVRFNGSMGGVEERVPPDQVFFFDAAGRLSSMDQSPALVTTGAQVLVPEPSDSAIRQSVAGSRAEIRSPDRPAVEVRPRSRVAGTRSTTPPARRGARRPAK